MTGHWLSVWLLCICTVISVTGELQSCPVNDCPSVPGIDLSPLRGLWETLYYTRADGEQNADIPSFFNISLCGSLTTPTSCSDARVCYSEHLESFHDLGQNCRYEYVAGTKQIRFVFDYASGLAFGNGNVSVTLVCGRTLGVPEVLEGDVDSHSIDILWVTSAACKNDSNLAPHLKEQKCYHIHPYYDNGVKAKFIDLSDLIRPEGYTVSYPEKPESSFKISVCHPLENVEPAECSGSLACLTHSDPGLASNIQAPLKLANFTSSPLHIEGSFLTVVYSVNVTGGACFDSTSRKGSRSVKIHFLCPTGNEDLGPRVTFLDNDLCLMVIHWYTSYACGNSAIQSAGCTLTTSLGTTFDLTGLSEQETVTSGSTLDAHGKPYTFDFKICSDNLLNSGCATRDQPIRVTQVASDGVCHVLGVGAGKLRYVEGELTLMFGLGDPCHTNFARTTIIHFICPDNVESNSSVITFSGEQDCFYEFEWVTPLACAMQDSGVSSCQFESQGGIYNFAPLVGIEDENWIALDTDPSTECFMINPCGTVSVSPDLHPTPSHYCNARLAPAECADTSVCQIFRDGTYKKVGHFNFGSDSTQIQNVDSSVVTIVGESDSVTNLTAVIHYVCKVGDLTTPPIYIGTTNDVLYEFHWMTYAACPTGVEHGNDCMVSHHSTGFVFNLTDLPAITFRKGDYQYNVSICNPLPSNQTSCPEAKNTAICQSHGLSHYSLGLSNRTLIYEDGTLKLYYTGGSQCHHNGNPHRNTTLIFVCDNTAHAPVINDVNEDYCNYAIEVRTKKACPPAYQAHSCLHFIGDKTFDFSPLSRASGAGNWAARGRDGSVYYINICQPLNSIAGCNPLSAVCRVQSSDHGVKYTNIALASSANFTSVTVAENEFNLVYTYKNLGGVACPTVTTTIRLVCSNESVFSGEVGPRYVSGGDDASPCEYLFTWDTAYACPIQPITNKSCSITTPFGFTFDLSPLDSDDKNSYIRVNSSAGHTYHMSLCNSLDHSCSLSTNDTGTVAVCQIASNNKHHSAGLANTRALTYFDGSFKMGFTGGDTCKHNNRPRSVLINFECDRTLSDYKGQPHFVSENEDCGYTFDWPTALACPPRELECVASGGRYDLQALLRQQVWEVRGLGDGYNYVIGGCRSLDFKAVSQCPQKPWMGACRYRDNDQPGGGTVLGYISGDVIEQGDGALVLTYTNGECSNGKRGVVHVHFQCGEALGQPTLVESDATNCVVRIDWSTKYACPRDGKTGKWIIQDPVTHETFDLTSLPKFLTHNYTEPDGSQYNFTVGLGGNGVVCTRKWKSENDTGRLIGACQYTLSEIHEGTHAVHSMGYVNSPQYMGGLISVEYTDGDECHHVSKPRKVVISFACEREPARDPMLEVFPEQECEYTFTVHTSLVCRGEDLGVPCVLSNFANLDVLQGLGVMEVRLNATAKAYLSVCGPLDLSDSRLSGCPRGAAACLITDNPRKTHHLGKPSQAPQALTNDAGVLIAYSGGDSCGHNHYSTRILLICNRNIPVGTPELVDATNCVYTFRWETINACPIHLSYTNSSKDVCSIDDSSSEFVYDFTNMVKKSKQVISAVDPHTNTTYYIQLCGTKSPLPNEARGCDPDNTGICRKGPNDHTATTIVNATHKIVLTSHTPHTVEVVYSSGIVCQSSLTWSAVVSLQCASRESSTLTPVFLSADDCRLDFVWQNSSFCVGEESCSVTDSDGTVYNFDGLFSQTWTGIVTSDSAHSIEEGGTFTMSVCRNLNPFATSGSHCSSPSGVCFHSPDGRHVNLGHVTKPMTVQLPDNTELDNTFVATYGAGDICNSTTGARYTTSLFLHCGEEGSVPIPILSLHNDVNSNCSWTIAMETPLACKPKAPPSPANVTNKCVMSTSEGEFDFTSLGKPLKFTSGDTTYSVCLCESSKCPRATINSTTSGQTTQLGLLDERSVTVSTVTGGPRLTFTGGKSCSSSSQIQTIIFMECNRTADKTKGILVYQSLLSDDCHKYFFWYTPYACVSDEVSCTIATDTGEVYDFSPLHSVSKPWMYKSGDKTYYFNICGEIVDRRNLGLEGCGPQSSVCVKDGSGTRSLATTSTQRMRVVSDGVEIRFGGDIGCGHNVMIVRMVCGLGPAGPSSSIDQSPGCYIHDFNWRTPYACGNNNKAAVATKCSNLDQAFFKDSYYSFQPSLLKQTSYSTTEGGQTFHVNLCGPAPDCRGNEVSVCEGDNPIASYTDQTIMVEGYNLLFEMTQGTSHAIVRVECVLSGEDGTYPPSGTLTLENIGQQQQHMYYYFTLYIREGSGCTLDLKTEPPIVTTHPPKAVPAGSNSVTAVVLILLAIAAVLTVVLVAVFYKKERRASFKHFLEKLIIGKADEPVKYHKVPRGERDEETALMDMTSDSDDSSVGIEGGGSEGVRVDVDISPEAKETNSDEELINI